MVPRNSKNKGTDSPQRLQKEHSPNDAFVFSPERPISDFWPPELIGNKFVLLEATKFMATWSSSCKTWVHCLLSYFKLLKCCYSSKKKTLSFMILQDEINTFCFRSVGRSLYSSPSRSLILNLLGKPSLLGLDKQLSHYAVVLCRNHFKPKAKYLCDIYLLVTHCSM